MPAAPSSVLFLAGRDTSHPEGGGSELYAEKATGLGAAVEEDAVAVE